MPVEAEVDSKVTAPPAVLTTVESETMPVELAATPVAFAAKPVDTEATPL